MFLEESSELPSEPEMSTRNLAPNTEILQIFPNQIGRNWFLHTSNYLYLMYSIQPER